MFDKIINLCHNIEEAKQVGTLYHFTNADKFIHIMQENSLKPAYLQKGGYNYISFTRNPNFAKEHRKGISGLAIVFTVDGDKLSNNHKIEPYNYYNYAYKRNASNDEREERVVGSGKYRISGVEIKDFMSYVQNITVDKQLFLKEMKTAGMILSERKDFRDMLGLNVPDSALERPDDSTAEYFYNAFIKYLNDKNIPYEVTE